MEARILQGTPVAERIRRDLAERIRRLELRGRVPRLAVVRLAFDAAARNIHSAPAEIYAARLESACREIGIRFSLKQFPADFPEDRLAAELDALGGDPEVSGILLQTPLPPHIDLNRIRRHIEPDKDVERINPINLGLVVYGKSHLAPCTAMSVLELLREGGVELRGKEAVVVGHSEIVGKPVALMLLDQLATVTVCHVATRDLAAHTRRADVLVVAVGKAGLIGKDMVKPGAAVIDVGVNRVPGPDGKPRVAGDVEFDEVRQVAGLLTPVPGGVGPVTTAMALRNAVLAAEAETS